MSQATSPVSSLSLRRIIGFAGNQGFVYFLFYVGLNRELAIGALSLERIDFIGMLFFLVLGFFVLRLVPAKIQKALFAMPCLLLYACMLAIGALIPVLGQPGGVLVLAESALLGLASAFLVAAWGRAFGEVSTKVAVPEVFLGSLAGALFGFVVSILPFQRMEFLFLALPFISAVAVILILRQGVEFRPAAMIVGDSSQEAKALSLKVLAGTALFGMAAGLMEVFNTDPGMELLPAYKVALLLFVAFSVGTLSLLLSDGFGRGAALNKAYRLAVFIMLMGLLLVPAPFFVGSVVSGEGIFFAGCLGLSAVLVSLFLVLASITGVSTLTSFSRGFSALFGGELIGVILANFLNTTDPTVATPYVVVVLAGTLVLFSYIFLFTERDFENLSEIVTDTDSFEERCQALVERFALSNREAEILPFVLRGRTSERISQELFIAKSTVDTHLRRIYNKAGVHNRQELIDLSE